MKKIINAFRVFFLFLSVNATAQNLVSINHIRIKPLSVGDDASAIVINNIINYPKNSVLISDFKGKLLILDFWATWCSPCIGSFPKLDSLQKKFEGKLQIMPVTDEDPNKVDEFFKKMRKIKFIQPASATGDTILNRYFRHSYLPHYVWIDGDGKVLAVTEGKDVNEDNIKKAIGGEKFIYALKDDKTNFHLVGEIVPAINKVMKDDQGLMEMNSTPQFYSILTKYIEGFYPGWIFIDSTGISIQNIAPEGLYKAALVGNGLNILNEGSIITEIPDPDLCKLITSRTPDGKRINAGLETIAWKREYAYCYSLKVPPALAKQRFKIMLDELNNYFGAFYGIEGVVEKRPCKYLALIRTTTIDKLATQGGEQISQADDFSVKLQNVPFKRLIMRFAKPLQSFPIVIDETNYEGNVDLELNCQLSDIKALNKELDKYGLQLKEKTKPIEVGVIKMKAKPTEK